MADSIAAPRTRWLILIALLGFLAFEPALRNSYSFDDVQQVQKLTVPHDIAGWWRAAAAPWWPPENPHAAWRPVTRLSILAQKALHPDLSWPFYAANILLEILAAWLLMLVALRLGMNQLAACIAAILFAIHPIHSEAVHQIVGRSESLAALCILCGIYFFLRFGFRLRWQILLQVLSYLFALGAKENAIVYPAFPLVIGIWHARDEKSDNGSPWRNVWPWLLLYAGFAFAAGIFICARWKITGAVFTMPHEVSWVENPIFDWPMVRRLPAALGIFGFAVSRFVFPLGLSPDYGSISLPLDLGWSWPYAWLGLLVIFVLAAVCVRGLSQSGAWAIILAGLISYAPTANLFFPIGVAVAERLWFWPSAFLCFFVGWVAERIMNKMTMDSARRRIFALGGVLIVLLLLTVDWHYAVAWRNPRSMADWTLRRYPDSLRAHLNLALMDYHERNFDAGYQHASAANVIRKDAGALNLIGMNAAVIPARRADAAEAYQRALQLDPSRHDIYRNWGLLLESEGRAGEALEKYRIYLARGGGADRPEIEARINHLAAN